MTEKDLTPPLDVVEEAERGLRWRNKYKRGGTSIGAAAAKLLSRGDPVSIKVIKNMVNFFDHHIKKEKSPGWRRGEVDFPNNYRIQWSLWAGSSGKRWSRLVYDKWQKERIAAVKVDYRIYLRCRDQ